VARYRALLGGEARERPSQPTVQCRAVQCSAVQCSAVQCSAVQCSAVRGVLGAGEQTCRPVLSSTDLRTSEAKEKIHSSSYAPTKLSWLVSRSKVSPPLSPVRAGVSVQVGPLLVVLGLVPRLMCTAVKIGAPPQLRHNALRDPREVGVEGDAAGVQGEQVLRGHRHRVEGV